MTSAIGIETLKIMNMLKNRNLAKALSDSALGGFLEKLQSKAEVLGIPIIEAPSSMRPVRLVAIADTRKKNCYYQKERMIATSVVSL